MWPPILHYVARTANEKAHTPRATRAFHPTIFAKSICLALPSTAPTPLLRIPARFVQNRRTVRGTGALVDETQCIIL